MRKPINIKITALAFAILIFLPIAVHAQAGLDSGAAPAGQGQSSPAAQFIQDLGNRAIGIAADKNLSTTQRLDKYHNILSQSFDLPVIAHFVIGRSWDSAPPEQQQEYLKLFQTLVVRTYGDKLNLYSGEKFDVKGSRKENDKDTVVNSVVTHADNSPPTPIDWRVRDENGSSKIVDVTIDGVSQSVTQRDEYSSIIQRDGGKLDGLLKLMRQRLHQPDNGPGDNAQSGNK